MYETYESDVLTFLSVHWSDDKYKMLGSANVRKEKEKILLSTAFATYQASPLHMFVLVRSAKCQTLASSLVGDDCCDCFAGDGFYSIRGKVDNTFRNLKASPQL